MKFLTNGVLEPLPFDDVHHLDASSSRHPSPTVIEDLVNRVRLFERKKREQDIWREVLAQDAQTNLTSQHRPSSCQTPRLSRSTSPSSSRKVDGPLENAEARRIIHQVRGLPMNAANLQQRYEKRDNFNFGQTFRNMTSPKRRDIQQTPQKLSLRDIRDSIYRQIEEFDREMEADTRSFSQAPRVNPTPAPIHPPVAQQLPSGPPRAETPASERHGPKPLPHQFAVR